MAIRSPGTDRRTFLKAAGVVGVAGVPRLPGARGQGQDGDSDTICGGRGDIVTHTVTGAGGVELRVDEIGAASGRPILLIHGWGGSRLDWTAQMHSSLADDFRLVAPDLRGHGRSDKPEDAYADSELWAGDIQAVIDDLGLEDPVLVGWSAGAPAIADYILINGEDDIAGVVLVGGSPLFEFEESMAHGEKYLELAGTGALVSTDAMEYITALDAFIPLLSAEPVPPNDHFLILGKFAIVPPYVRAQWASHFNSTTYDDLLRDIESPVLLVHGEEDGIILPAVAERHADAIPNARTSFYPEVGHLPPIENIERFNRELREFVTGL